MKLYKILHRLLIVGLFIYNWIQLHRSDTTEEILKYGFDTVIWLVVMVLIAVMVVKNKDEEKVEEVEAEEVKTSK